MMGIFSPSYAKEQGCVPRLLHAPRLHSAHLCQFDRRLIDTLGCINHSCVRRRSAHGAQTFAVTEDFLRRVKQRFAVAVGFTNQRRRTCSGKRQRILLLMVVCHIG